MEENVNVGNTQNGGDVSEKAKANLKSSYTWVMVIAILGFIGGGIMAIGGLLAMIGSVGSGLVTLAMAAIYIYMAMLLLRQANAVKSDKLDMDTFAKSYLMYWKIIVILIILSVVFSIVMYFSFASQANSIPSQFDFNY